MTISIGTNIASLQVQRRLGEVTSGLNTSFQRLSSGLRINRASDDAAGLAISASLNADARVYAQGARNFNDGISMLSISEGSLQELSSIATRIKELASEAANGTYSNKQRQALDQEADSLVDEYNRIVQTTSFNNVALLNNPGQTISLQGGYGNAAKLDFSLGQDLANTVGNGTFKSGVSYSTPILPNGVEVADFNGDGYGDVISALTVNSTNRFSISLGSASGTLSAAQSIYTSAEVSYTNSLTTGDFNNDGKRDVFVTVDSGKGYFMLGNGDGTFKSGVTVSSVVLDDVRETISADFNNDGNLDIAMADHTLDRSAIMFGNGNGTFTAIISFTSLGKPDVLNAADLNNDGFTDLISAADNGGGIEMVVILSNGNGTFKAPAPYTSYFNSYFEGMDIGDINGDGFKDIAHTDTGLSSVMVLYGNGNGTFKASVSINLGLTGPTTTFLRDLDGDNVLDLAIADSAANAIRVFKGNGNGTFNAGVSFATTFSTIFEEKAMTIGDVNADGALDFVTNNYTGNSIAVLLANTQIGATLAKFDLTTQDSARSSLPLVAALQTRISSEMGRQGAAQSQIVFGQNNLKIQTENYIEAASRITDVDVAEEVAKLTRLKILQQASAAVLAQANTAPEIALQLINGSN